MGRSVDLAYLEGDSVCTVEFKRADWRRALNQARDHLLGADFAYVCLPERSPSEAFVKAAQESGIGILRFRHDLAWPFEVICEAKRSPETWVVARDRVIRQLITD